jgi:hypothetical protein
VIALGEVVRGVALLGLLAHAVLAAAALVTGLPGAMRLRMMEPAQAVRMTEDVGGSVAVLVTFAALIRGRRSLARWAAIVAVAPGLVELGRTLARDTAWLDPVLMLAWVTPRLGLRGLPVGRLPRPCRACRLSGRGTGPPSAR